MMPESVLMGAIPKRDGERKSGGFRGLPFSASAVNRQTQFNIRHRLID